MDRIPDIIIPHIKIYYTFKSRSMLYILCHLRKYLHCRFVTVYWLKKCNLHCLSYMLLKRWLGVFLRVNLIMMPASFWAARCFKMHACMFQSFYLFSSLCTSWNMRQCNVIWICLFWILLRCSLFIICHISKPLCSQRLSSVRSRFRWNELGGLWLYPAWTCIDYYMCYYYLCMGVQINTSLMPCHQSKVHCGHEAYRICATNTQWAIYVVK